MKNEQMIEKNRKKSLSVGIIVNLLATFLLRAIGLITAPITTRLLETSDYGAMSIYNTWVGIATIVLGLQACGTFNNARIKFESKEEYYKYCWNALFISFIGHLVFIIIIFPWVSSLSSLIGITELLICLMIVQSFMQNGINMLSGHLLIENKAGWNLVLSGFVSLGSFVFSVLLVHQPTFREMPYMAFIVGNFIPTAITGIVAVIWFGKKGASKIKTNYIKYCLSLSFSLIFHGLSGIVLGQSDRIMLERMIDLSEAGVYSLTYNFSSILLGVWGAINSIWIPFYFRYLKEGNYSELKKRMINFDMLFTVLYLGFLFLSPEVFHLMDSRYWYQMNIIPILIIGFYFNHLYAYPANYEFYKEKTVYIAIASTVTAILNIILNYMLIPCYQAMGAAIATTLSYIITYLFHSISAHFFVKEYPFSYSLDIWRLIPIGIITATFFVCQNVAWLRWIFAVILGSVYLLRVIKRRELL